MLSDYLKQNSREQHTSLEEKFRSNHIFDKTYSLQDYKKFLYANYALYHALEPSLENILSEDFKTSIQYNERKKLTIIEKEIKVLELPLLADLESQTIENEAEAIGILYVMEGSTLGGNIIKKHLANNIEFVDIDFNFLGIYGSEIGNYWKNFIFQINQNIQEKSYKDVLAGTLKAYSFLQNFNN